MSDEFGFDDQEYQDYDQACQVRREENERYIHEFESWLTAQGLSQKTIQRHVSNVDFFLNSYLLLDRANRMEVGCERMGDFLGYFLIRKCMWSTPATIRQNATSLKKFYKCMLEKGHIAQESYDVMLADIKEGMPLWLEDCEAFNNPGEGSHDDPFGLGPDNRHLFDAVLEAVAQNLGFADYLESADGTDETDDEEELPSRQEIIDELTLVLLYLTSWREEIFRGSGIIQRRSWKSADWNALDFLREHGFINCANKDKSVTITDSGVQMAELTLTALGLDHLIERPQEQDRQATGNWTLLK